MPAGYALQLDDDVTRYIREELEKIQLRTTWSLAILLLFVILIYRDWRTLVTVILALIANLGLAFIAYYAVGIELHLYALAGITVSFGMVIDNTIIMMHHWQQRCNLGVMGALTAATLTTMAALLVVFWLPEAWQLNLRAFAEVMGINLLISLLVAWWMVPALLEVLGGQTKIGSRSFSRKKRALRSQKAYRKVLGFLLKKRWIPVSAMILLFGLPVFLLPNKITGWEWYNRSIGSDWYQEKAKPIVNRALGGTLRLFSWYTYESSGFRQAEETVLHIRARLQQGATLEQMDAICRQMEDYLSQYSDKIRLYATRVYSGENSSIQVFFKREYESVFPYQLKNRVIAHSTNLGGVKWQIYGVGQGFSNEGGSQLPSYRIAMYGYNKEALEQQAVLFASKLLVHPRIQTVDTDANVGWEEKDRFEFFVPLPPDAVTRQGLERSQLEEALFAFNRSTRSDFMHPDGKPVRIEQTGALPGDRWRLEKQAILSDTSALLLQQSVGMEKPKVDSSIHKNIQQYIRMVEYEYTGSARFGNQYTDECMSAMRREMPLGYTMERRSYHWGREELKRYGLLAGVGLLIAWICAITFESFRQAFAILILVPCSYVGIFLTFYWGDFSFDQGGYTSFLLLSGLVVNALILIINEYNHQRKLHPLQSKVTAYVRATGAKITPVLLTVLSTVLGMIPFLMHGDREIFWFALAAGTIGGLVFSILVLLLIAPLFSGLKR